MGTGARVGFSFVIGLLVTPASSAQVDPLHIPVRHLSIADGLSQGMVGGIIQDRVGFMWFATKDGLNRYDGYTFKVYRHDTQDSTSVRDNHIHAVCEDSKGLLFISTNSGLDVFDPATERFHHIPHVKDIGKYRAGNPLSVYCIVEDAFGNIWFNGGWELYRIRPDTTADMPWGPWTHPERFVEVHNGGLFIDHAGNLRALARIVVDHTDLTTDYLHINTRDEQAIIDLARARE